MKELTTEEKAKHYDEASKWMEGIYPTLTHEQQWGAEAFFPELKESEDEKIKKNLIGYFLYYPDHDINYYGLKAASVIAWLEKQGKQKPQGKSALEAIKEEKVDNANKVEPKDYSSIDPHFGKPIDKIEHGFKVGDWIIGNINKVIFLLKSFNSGYCTLEDTEGRIYSPCVPPNENDYHLWTIQNAKDGDVLAFDNDTIVIFEYLYNATTFRSYCHIEDGVFSDSQDDLPDWWEDKGFHPATKKQRDTLIKAMTDAGYTFDFEKKELKKIEQKPAWSEEDESYLNTTIAYLKDAKEFKKTAENCINWLKSLRHQNTWKPSELQMECLYDAIKHYQTNGYPASKLNELYEQMSKIYKL